jgi:predicted secreted protein
MAKYAAKGAQLHYENPSSTWVPVINIGDFTLNLGDTEQIDVTTHDSAGSYREFLNGFKNAADFSVPLVYDPAAISHEYLRAAHGGTAKSFRVTLPDSGNAQFFFDGIVTGFEVGLPVDGALGSSVTIKPTGAITFTA